VKLRLQALRSLPSKYFRKRRWRKERLKYGISEEDSWDLFSYLNEVIPRGVRQLAENLHGCPAGLADNFDGDVDKACEVWKTTLEEIAQGFEADQAAQARFEASPADFDNAMHLLHEHWRDLWD
jgi:hypothetical protein